MHQELKALFISAIEEKRMIYFEIVSPVFVGDIAMIPTNGDINEKEIDLISAEDNEIHIDMEDKIFHKISENEFCVSDRNETSMVSILFDD